MTSDELEMIRSVAEKYGRDPHRMMDVVRDVHARSGYISDDAVEEMARALGVHRVQVQDMVSFYSFLDRTPAGACTIRLSNCVADRMKGMEEVAKAFERELGIGFGQTTPDGMITLKYTACIGMCDQAPAALIDEMVVTDLKPSDVPAIVAAIRAGKGRICSRDAFPGSEVGLGLRQAGPVVLGPFENGSAIRRALGMTPEGVIEEINGSRLRGRGGAGFPTGLKWSLCRKAEGPRYVVCNADEGEPGTFKDRLILTESPDLLFEGMTIAGYALGASEGLLYLRAEYAFMWAQLQKVLDHRRRNGLLGDNICGKEGFRFDIRIQLGAGAYVCGEESSLIESLEGKRGAPRDRPPYPVQKGYLDRPTSVNNVETLVCAARILERGAEWFAGFGTRDSTGTKLLSVSGDCSRPGVYEIEYGMTVAQLLELVGGDDAQAVQVGGPSGQCLAPKDYGRSISFEDVATGGSIIVFGPGRDLLEYVHAFTEFFVEESCGWCAPCRVGTVLIGQKLEKIMEGRGTESDLADLRQLGLTVKTMSRCGLGQTAANPVLTTLQNFPGLYRGRITDEEFIPHFDVDEAFSEYGGLTGRQYTAEEHQA